MLNQASDPAQFRCLKKRLYCPFSDKNGRLSSDDCACRYNVLEDTPAGGVFFSFSPCGLRSTTVAATRFQFCYSVSFQIALHHDGQLAAAAKRAETGCVSCPLLPNPACRRPVVACTSLLPRALRPARSQAPHNAQALPDYGGWHYPGMESCAGGFHRCW
jgi:hypothetical protein